MTKRELTPPKLNLTRDPNQPPLRVEMESFFDFSFWLAEELQDLEAMYDPYRNTAGFDCDIPFPDDLATQWDNDESTVHESPNDEWINDEWTTDGIADEPIA